MNTYDEGKDGEETSVHTREKVGSENKNKVFTEEEKADETDNLNDIKSYKLIIISNNEDIKKVETLDVEEDTLVMLTKGSTKNERKSNPKKVTKAKEELQK